jgi:NADH-quinone oxidoreductase subunit H
MVVVALAFPERRVDIDDDYVPTAGSRFPVPPLNLDVPDQTPRRKALAKAEARQARRRQRAAVAAGKENTDGVH